MARDYAFGPWKDFYTPGMFSAPADVDEAIRGMIQPLQRKVAGFTERQVEDHDYTWWAEYIQSHPQLIEDPSELVQEWFYRAHQHESQLNTEHWQDHAQPVVERLQERLDDAVTPQALTPGEPEKVIEAAQDIQERLDSVTLYTRTAREHDGLGSVTDLGAAEGTPVTLRFTDVVDTEAGNQPGLPGVAAYELADAGSNTFEAAAHHTERIAAGNSGDTVRLRWPDEDGASVAVALGKGADTVVVEGDELAGVREGTLKIDAAGSGNQLEVALRVGCNSCRPPV